MVPSRAQQGNERLSCGRPYFYYVHLSLLHSSHLVFLSLDHFSAVSSSSSQGIPLLALSEFTIFARKKTHQLCLTSVLLDLLVAGSRRGIAFPDKVCKNTSQINGSFDVNPLK